MPNLPRSNPPEPIGPDPDDERVEAAKILAKRALLFLIPLLLLGVLVTALGVPWWITAIAIVIAEVILVFELEF